MKTDTIFYSLFQLFPELLFQLIGEDPAQAINYEFSSQEIKELARRFDGVMIPDGKAFTDLIYFVEVQFQPKVDFYWQLFVEIAAYLGQYQPPNDWQAVAIFASRNLDPEFPAQYRGLRPQVRMIYLDEIINQEDLPISLGIVKLVLIPQEQVKDEFPKLREQAERIQDQELEQKILEFIETVLFYKFIHMSREEVAEMFSLDNFRGTRFFEDVKAEGKAEGERLGKAEGKLEAIQGFLALGIGVEQIAQALGIDVTIAQRVAAGEVVSPESLLENYES